MIPEPEVFPLMETDRLHMDARVQHRQALHSGLPDSVEALQAAVPDSAPTALHFEDSESSERWF